MEFSIEKFNDIKHEAENFYEKIGKVYCPYLQQEVHFNRTGLEHLLFKQFNKTRPVEDQLSRLRHIKLAPQIIKDSKTLQGLKKTTNFERVKRNKRWENISKQVTYYEFIAIMESHGSLVRMKVIVKQIEGAEKHFLSIIPFWGKNKIPGERILHTGDPEVD